MKLKITLLAALTIASTVLIAPADGELSCAPDDHPGGDWPSYAADVQHTRHQPAEDHISAARAATLAAAWNWTAPAGTGSFSGTPVVADGCVFVGAQTGWVHAIHADTGTTVWSKQVESNPEVPFSSGGAGINSSLAVSDGKVYVSATTYEAPYVAALDIANGDVLWTTTVEAQAGAGIHSSPLVIDGLVLVGWDTAGIEFDAELRKTAYGGFVVIDADSGALLKRTYTIPIEDRPDGYSGGNIWSSFSADPTTKHAFIGTAAPYSPQAEHENTNAILKVDIDRASETFGQIVDSYKGVPDHFFSASESIPCVPVAPGSNFAEGTGPCQKLDLDMAASPNVFTDSNGRTIVGALQKAGVYHFVDADTMEGLHDVVVGNMALGYAPTNMGSTTFDGEAIYGAGGSANTIFALDRDSADVRWRSSSLDIPIHVNPLASANGVIYTLNGAGPLMAFDARTGFPLVVLDAPSGIGSGVSIARNTVFAAGGDAVTALQPDPARADEVALWEALLSAIPTPPMTPHVDKTPL